MNKKAFIAALLIFAATLFGCFSEEKSVDFDITSAADKIADTYGISGGKRYSSSGNGRLQLDEDLIRAYFGDAADIPDFSKIAAYEVYIDETKPTTPCEYAIFTLADAEYGDTLKAYLEQRITLKLANAKMYPSVETSMLKSARFTVKGKYVWYCAVKDANAEIDGYLADKAEGKE